MNALPILKRFRIPVLLAVILAAAGCGDGGGSGSTSNSTGTLSLQITDGPVETAEHVYVQFSGLELHAADGQRTMLYYCEDPADPAQTVVSDTACTTPPAPKQLDLLVLTGGEADFLLQDFTLPAGHYNWIRLMVDTDDFYDSYIVIGSVNHELTIPSGDQTGLKLNRGFTVPAGGSAYFTIDFDLRKSVHFTGNDPNTGEYMLRPTLRLADNTMVGTISGEVSNTLITTCDPVNDHPAVYVYEGSSVTPDDIDGTEPEPVTSASVKYDSVNMVYTYKAWFLEPGTYTVAFTCDAAADDPTVDNTSNIPNVPLVAFSGDAASVSVTANNNTVHDF